MQFPATVIFLLVFCFSLFPLQEKRQSQDTQSIGDKFNELRQHPSLKDASLGFVILDPRSGQVLFEHHPDQMLIPASVLKLVTTTSAIYLLDTSFRFNTWLKTSGPIDKNGNLNGDIIIEGGGDPSLASPFLENTPGLDSLFGLWLGAIKSQGIKSVNGQIIADPRIFDNQIVPPHWGDDDTGNYYGAGASGLSFHENFYTLFFKASLKIGSPASIAYTYPPLESVTFDNRVTTGPKNSGDNVIIYGKPYKNHRILTGTIPAQTDSFAVKGSIPDPAALMAELFHAFLTHQGISISGKPIVVRDAGLNNSMPNDGKLIFQLQSPSLHCILDRTNKKSVNTYAENLLKMMGYKYLNSGSFTSGIQIIRAFWQQRGIDVSGLEMYDGSGLSRLNRVSPRFLSQLLLWVYKDPIIFPYFQSTLSVSGEAGTLEKRFSDKAKGLIHAKSGYMKGVRAFAGYAKTQNGQDLIFVLMANHSNGISAQARELMISLIESITLIE